MNDPIDVDALVLDEDPRNPTGRPSSYDDSMPYKVFLAIPEGATWSAIARACERGVSTIRKWADPRQETYHEDFGASIARAHDIVDDNVVTSTYQKATGYSIVQSIVDKKGVVHDLTVHVPADPQAFKYWLNNRRRKEWNEKQELELSGGVTIEQLTDTDLDAELASVAAALEAEEAGAGTREATATPTATEVPSKTS